MTAISKNFYFDALDDTVNKYGSYGWFLCWTQ